MTLLKRLISSLIIVLFLISTSGGCGKKQSQPAVVPEEFPVTEIRLKGPLASPDQEVSGMAWFKDRLIFLPQSGAAGALAPENHPALYYLEKKDILAYLQAEEAGGSPLPLEPTAIPLVIEPELYAKIGNIVNFEGFEAIGFWHNRAFLTLESSPPGQMLGFLVSGEMAADISKLTLTGSGTDNPDLVRLQPQAAIGNACYESLLVLGDQVLVFYEGNGKNVNPSPRALVYDINLRFTHSIAFPNIEYRLTDASGPDDGNRFWCINYFWPGGDEAVEYNPAQDHEALQFGKGKTHAGAVIVERLVEFQYVKNAAHPGPGARITRTPSPPVQLVLMGPGIGSARNWEGLVRLDDRGFLVVTDEHPRTILGFVGVKKNRDR